MTYDLVKNFVTVARTGNITRTAEILFVSQSTVSHRLQLLEAETGHPLVDRGKGKRVATLTQWGTAFLPIAEKWLELWQETEAFRREETEQTLSVSCVNSLTVCLLRRFFSDFVHRHPEIHLRLTVLDTDTIYQKLDAGELDMGIVLAKPGRENVSIRPMLSEKMYCVCSPDMFPGKTQIHPRELDPRQEILLNWNVEFMLWHDFRFPGSIRPRMEVNTIMLIEDALLRETGWAVVPETVAAHFEKRGVARRLSLATPPPDRISYVATRILPEPRTRELTSLFSTELDHFLGNSQEKR